MPYGPHEAHLSLEVSISHDYVVQVASFWPSTNEQQGLPPDWFIKSNDGCDMVALDKLTYKLQCVVTSMYVNHFGTYDDFIGLIPC